MTKSIFDIERRLDINKEFQKMIKYLHQTPQTTYAPALGFYTTFIEAVDISPFKKWPYKDTALNTLEYLEDIGINEKYFKTKINIEEEKFLYYIEYIYNIYQFSNIRRLISIDSEDVSTILENINLIAEKLNYQFFQENDKYILIKRDVNLDSILSLVEEDISSIMLEYHDFKIHNNLTRKSEILKSLDKYFEKNQATYSKVDKESYSSWGYIVNNFGINHKINAKYESLSRQELIKWYDKAFALAIHLIRLTFIKDINQERKNLEK